MQSTWQRLIGHWQAQGLPIQEGNSHHQLKGFESKYQVALPCEVREYLLNVDGMSPYWPGSQDQEGYSFWPLKRIKSVPEEAKKHSGGKLWSSFPDAKSHFIFADYLHWSWSFALALKDTTLPETPIFLIGKKEMPIQVSQTFSEFVDLYIMDSPILYGVSV